MICFKIKPFKCGGCGKDVGSDNLTDFWLGLNRLLLCSKCLKKIRA